MREGKLIIAGILVAVLLLAGCNKLMGTQGSSDEEPENEIENTVEEEQSEPEEKPKIPDELKDEELVEDHEEEPIVEEEEPEEQINIGDYEVFLGGEMLEEKDKIIVNGVSNLIPGTRVIGEVFVGDEEEPIFHADTSEKVEDDSTFYMELASPDSKGEEVEVRITFHFDTQQSDEVIRHYGERGQKMEGSYIYKHQREIGGRSNKDIYQKAMVKTVFKPGETLAVRQFKEPKWYDLPEDLGDTRVWLEVDEMNDDKEFYYVHGRSNLIEGSKIKAEYGYNHDTTYVLPDGSFDFKIDYEYRENTPFVIQFKPSDFQWNTVEEVYGMDGQKLVGNLVETNKFNNKQYIEKEIGIESQEIEVPDNVELNVDGSEITMLVPDDVLFDFDTYNLKDSSKKVLKGIAKTLDKSFNKKDLDILITGHTDNVGNDKYNQELSEKRANEVKDYLEKQLKADQATFTTEGYGAKKPIASNDTEKGQAKNRRVEIMINFK